MHVRRLTPTNVTARPPARPLRAGGLAFAFQSHEPAKLIFAISNLLILACIPCRIAGNRHAEDAILVFALPGSWFLLMFFAG